MGVREASEKRKKGEKTRQRLFDSAAGLFKKYEVDEITVDAIVETAGVAKGTFYIYFESKDALLAALIEDYVSGLDIRYKAHLDALPDGAKTSERILSLIEKITDVIANSIGYELMRTAYKVQLTKSVDTNSIKGYDRALYKMFADVLRGGMEKGELETAFLPDELAKHFIMAIRGLCYEWCIRYPDFDLQKQALAHFKMLLHGISVKTVDAERNDFFSDSIIGSTIFNVKSPSLAEKE